MFFITNMLWSSFFVQFQRDLFIHRRYDQPTNDLLTRTGLHTFEAANFLAAATTLEYVLDRGSSNLFWGGLASCFTLVTANRLMERAEWDPAGKVYRFTHALEGLMPRLARLANVISAIVALYLGAPVLGIAGVTFVYHTSGLMLDLITQKKDASLAMALISGSLRPQAQPQPS